MAGDPFDLQRFVTAQDAVMNAVRDELARGRKRSHWMWFVFPQLKGLGMSSTARHYGIASLEEAKAYLAHPVLGARLRECCELLLAPGVGRDDQTAHDIFGSPDDLKLRSCLTLFDRAAAPGDDLFRRALDRYYGGEPDPRTLALLA